MATPRLLAAVAHAFSENGPVHRRMTQFRPLQQAAALAMAQFAQEQYDQPKTFQRLFAQEQRAGIGKTIAVGVVLGLDAVLNDNRGLVSTATRALRAGYLTTLDDVNAIIQLTLNDLGCGERFRRITMAERISVSQNISPSKIADLERRIKTGVTLETPLHRALIDFFNTTMAHGDDPTFDLFLYERNGALPERTTQNDWAMCVADRSFLLWKEIIERNDAAQTADIVLVTHSMAIRNSVSRGRALNTRAVNDDEKRPSPTGLFVIDEADKLPQVAYDAQSPTTSLLTITSLLNEMNTVYLTEATREATKDAVKRGVDKTKEGLEFFEDWNAGHDMEPATVVDKEDFVAIEILENLALIDEGLNILQHVSYGQFNPLDRDILMSDKIERVQENLHAIRDFQSYNFPKMSLRTFINPASERDLEMMVNLGLGRNLINQYWRPKEGFPLHSFSGVIAVSATMTDLPPHSHRYTWFRKHFGYDLQKDVRRLVEKSPIPASRRESYGSVEQVIVPDRVGSPRPLINGDDESSYRINPDFVEFAAIAITQFARIQVDSDARMLALFPSYDLIDQIHAQLPHLHERIVARKQGSNLHLDIKRFADTPRGIFFGVEWEGVNFVERNEDGTQRTLVDYLVLTKIPQPPSDHIRQSRIADGMVTFFDLPDEAAERKAFSISLRDGSAHAYRKMVQGLGRGARNETDVIRAVLILDDRFPVPRHVASNPKAQIIRCGHNGGTLFGTFDSIFDPYAVKKWSKMDKNGEIKPIYPV